MSPTETALRAAVAAAPDAALPRLVLADYLDDQNQPTLAAAVRLDVALAGERPWVDRYWRLKAESPADFPADLARLADRQPLLCGVPDDWRSRWRVVRAFVGRWWHVPLGDVGDCAVPSDLPPAVRAWEPFARELADADEEAFRDPWGLDRVPGQPALSLLEQAEGDAHWAVRDADLGAADPPVYLFVSDDGPSGFAPLGGRYAQTVAGFALLYLLSYRADMRSVLSYLPTRTALATDCLHAGRFDLAEAFESPGRATVLLPPGSWGYDQAHLFELTRAQAAPGAGVCP